MDEKKIILIFDICSSTTIIEDLIRNESFDQWRQVIKGLNVMLIDNKQAYDYVIYKFIGDGWILLFNPDINGNQLFKFMELLIHTYNSLNRSKLKKYLTVKIPIDGISFGADIGTLKKIRLEKNDEYIGRSLNIASRLQGSISQKDSNPANKILMSKKLYMSIRNDIMGNKKYLIKDVTRTLKNISGGDNYLCKKIIIKAT